MKRMNYLYVDDSFNKTSEATLTPMIRKLEESNRLKIQPLSIALFEKLVKTIEREMEIYDGVILDLKLSSELNDEKVRLLTDAPTIAQHLRNLTTDKKTKDVPIILCSTDSNIKNHYNRDTTSHDLFDMRFLKDPKDKRWELIVGELYALAEGYKLLEVYKGNFEKIFEVKIEDLDNRILARFDKNIDSPLHEIAHYILKELIFINVPLINEDILAARLGIDIERSQDFKKLISQYFNEAKYTGIFSNGWNRWWMHILYSLFEKLVGKPIHILDAKQKVKLLKEKTGLTNLSYAGPIKKCESFKYWVVCKGFNKPLDPREGYRVNPHTEPKPWQEYEYISLEAVLERVGFDEKEIFVHPIDKKRLEIAKEEFNKMDIPLDVKKFRSKKANDLNLLANIFEKNDFDSSQIIRAVAQLENFLFIPKVNAGDPVNPNYWGYEINNFVIPIEEIPKDLHPKDTKRLELSLSFKLIANFEDYKKHYDPFKWLEMNVLIKGESEYWGEVINGFHIDRHIDGENPPHEIHPAYHVHFGGRQLNLEQDIFGASLFLGASRILHYPMDLILGIDFLMCNFFPIKRINFLKEQTYINILKEYQEVFLKPFAHSLANHWKNYNPPVDCWAPNIICPQLLI